VKAVVAVSAGLPLSVRVTEKLDVPPAVGEPVIAQVVLLIARPVGRAPCEIVQV
jgi:hypothetical protein